MKLPMIGLSANEAGAHTRELVDGFTQACEWLGCQPNYFWAEDGRNPTQARIAAQTLIDMDVQFVLGHLSAAASIAAAEGYRKNNMALFAPATSHPALQRSNWPGIIRVFGTDERTAQAMVEARPIDGQPAVLFQRQIYGVSLGRELLAALRVHGHEPYAALISETAPLPALPESVSHVFIAAIHEVAADAVIGIRQSGFTGTIALGDDCLTPNFMALAGDHAEGCLVISPIWPEAGISPDSGYKPSSAIAASVAIQAFQKDPCARGAELGKLITGQSWMTPHGEARFDPSGNLRGMRETVYEVRDGAFVAIS